jgi:hypothetical protein
VIACTRFNNKTWQEYQTWMTTYQQSYEHIYKRPLKCIYGAPREISHKKIPPQAKILVIEMNNDENKIMGIGEIQNQTASEVYRSPSGGGHNTTQSSLRTVNGAELPSQGGGTPGGQPPFKSSTQSNEVAAVGGRIPPFHKIFSDRNYARYIYIGNTRYATREELERNHTEDAQYINEQLANIITLPQTPPPSNSTVGEYLRREHHDPHPPSWGGGHPLEILLFKGARHMKRGSGITRCSFMK